MKIVINIPDIKMKVRPWFDKIVQSLTYDPDEVPKKAEEQASVQAMKDTKTEVPQHMSDNEIENVFIPKRKGVAQQATKIQVQTEDLHLISTALIRYKKHLTQNKQLEKAQRVGELDQLFYEVITQKSSEGTSKVRTGLHKEQVAQVG
ncbi:MAG TPA: hypothetical protein DCS93_11180 [Microscillaceae bacterium]|nr:hypothetical protein [Microscillaceae bacterium]